MFFNIVPEGNIPRTCFIFFLLFFLIITSGKANALSIGVSPSALEFTKKETQKQVVVFNPNNDSAQISFEFEAENKLYKVLGPSVISRNSVGKYIVTYVGKNEITSSTTIMIITLSKKGETKNVVLKPSVAVQLNYKGGDSLNKGNAQDLFNFQANKSWKVGVGILVSMVSIGILIFFIFEKWMN